MIMVHQITPFMKVAAKKSGCKDKMFKFNWLGTCAPTIQTVIFLDFKILIISTTEDTNAEAKTGFHVDAQVVYSSTSKTIPPPQMSAQL